MSKKLRFKVGDKVKIENAIDIENPKSNMSFHGLKLGTIGEVLQVNDVEGSMCDYLVSGIGANTDKSTAQALWEANLNPAPTLALENESLRQENRGLRKMIADLECKLREASF